MSLSKLSLILLCSVIAVTVKAEKWHSERRHHPPPVPPTAANIAVNTPINTPISIDLSQGSTGNPTSAMVIGPVTGGTEMMTAALSVTFTPGMGFTGRGGFNFTLSNAFGTSNTAHVCIAVQ